MFNAHLHLAQIPYLPADAAPDGCALAAARPDEWNAILAEQHPCVRVKALGIHPWFAHHATPSRLEQLAETMRQNPTLAIGEIGLCGLRKECPLAGQLTAFEAQLALAQNLARPVILHGARRWQLLLQTLRRYNLPALLLHAFNGSSEELRQALELHPFVSVGPAILAPNARRLRQLAAQIPDDSLLVETDTAPPERLHSLLEELARVRTCSIEELATLTSRNAYRFYGLKG